MENLASNLKYSPWLGGGGVFCAGEGWSQLLHPWQPHPPVQDGQRTGHHLCRESSTTHLSLPGRLMVDWTSGVCNIWGICEPRERKDVEDNVYMYSWYR